MMEKRIDTRAISKWLLAADDLFYETQELKNELIFGIRNGDSTKIDDTARKLRGLYSMITENYNLMCDYTRCH